MEYKDYYKILGVSRDAGQDEIRRAYRKLAHKYHPDVSKASNAEERFKEIKEAYEVLSNPEKRAAYDQLGSGWAQGEPFEPPPGWESAFGYGGGHSARSEGTRSMGTEEFSEFFESLFGGGFEGMGGFGGRGRGTAWGGTTGFASQGEDQHARIEIRLEEAYQGGQRQIQLAVPERSAQGQITQSLRNLTVRIPAGIQDGQQIRLAGQGAPGVGGAPAGDLYLEVRIRPHPHFQLEGKDVHLHLPVSPWEAALGEKLQVPTLGGSVALTLPSGVRSGQRLRLKGRGLPGNPPGDQYVIVQIQAPRPENEEQAELYRTMARQMPFNPRKHLKV